MYRKLAQLDINATLPQVQVHMLRKVKDMHPNLCEIYELKWKLKHQRDPLLRDEYGQVTNSDTHSTYKQVVILH